MPANITAFKNRLRLWEFQPLSNNSANFSALGTMEMSTNNTKCAHINQVLRQFSSRFQDFRKLEATLIFLSAPFNVTVETIPDEFQVEVTDLQNKFRGSTLLDFCKLHLLFRTFPRPDNHTRQMVSLSGNTFVSSCRQT
jgi:hypothetical protein